MAKHDKPIPDWRKLGAQIVNIIESVENRCMAYDGPVGNTREEMTDREMKEIYHLARKIAD